MTEFPAEYDSPWKAGLELYFQPFVEYCFPDIYSYIDWSRGYESMDKELEQVVRDAELGKRLADKLFKVWLTNGTTTWILIHVEVQGQQESDFAERIYVYNYRCFDRFRKPVISLVVLGDEAVNWRPSSYGYSLDGFELLLKFPTIKLLDYEPNWGNLEQSTNPFAVMIMAHLKTKATTGDMEQRRQWKWTLVRGLYERGYNKEDILELFRLVDWMMTLPKELQIGFEEQLEDYQEIEKMPIYSQRETRAIQREARKSLLEVLEVRFQEVPQAIAETVDSIDDMTFLRQLRRQAILIGSVEEFQVSFEEQLENYQERNKMPIYSQIETRAMRREALRGARESLLEVLKVRFQHVPQAIAETVNSIYDVAFLKQLHRQAIVIGSVEEFEQLLVPEQK